MRLFLVSILMYQLLSRINWVSLFFRCATNCLNVGTLFYFSLPISTVFTASSGSIADARHSLVHLLYLSPSENHHMAFRALQLSICDGATVHFVDVRDCVRRLHGQFTNSRCMSFAVSLLFSSAALSCPRVRCLASSLATSLSIHFQTIGFPFDPRCR